MATTTGDSTAPGSTPPGWFAPLGRVLVRPGPTLAGVARGGRGFEIILLLLLLELALVHPAAVARSVVTMSFDFLGGLSGLYSSLLSFALVPGVTVFALGVVAYYMLRRTPHRVELWGATSAAAYAYTPHVLLVAAAVVLRAVGLEHPVLPTSPLSAATGGTLLLRGGIELAPVAWVGWRGWQTLTQTGAPARGPRLPAPMIGILAGALLIAAAVVNTQAVRARWASVRPVMPADPLPAFSLGTLQGDDVLTNHGIAGKVALIDFWATWCGPCVASMPSVAELHHELGPRGLQVVSVNTEPDNREGVRAFSQRHALPFPVYVDTGVTQHRFRVSTLPTFMVVDRRGHIRHVHVGATAKSTLRKEIEALLNEEI